MIRKHLTYANVMSTIAVFVVMGGSAYALAKHSVGTKQLKNKAVTTKKIKNGAVTGSKIAAGSIGGAAINPTSFNVTVTSTTAAPITPGNVGGGTATCPAGKKAIAGGGLSDSANNGAYIEDSRPVNGATGAPTAAGTFTGWRVIWQNQTGANNKTPTVYAVCLG
jgi:hypothetical protein